MYEMYCSSMFGGQEVRGGPGRAASSGTRNRVGFGIQDNDIDIRRSMLDGL